MLALMAFILAAAEPAAAKHTSMSTDDVLKSLAVIVGGAWTYLNYVRGRTFRKRLEVEITGSIFQDEGLSFFSGRCHLKNVGLAQTKIVEVGTGVSIYTLRLVETASGRKTSKEEIVVLPLFEKHGWVEPGESISDPFVAVLPERKGRLLGVRTVVMISNGKIVWQAAQFTEAPFPSETRKSDEKTSDHSATREQPAASVPAGSEKARE